MPSSKVVNEFSEKLRKSVKKKQFVKLTLGKRAASDQELQNIFVRYIELKGTPTLSFTYRYKKKDVVKNHSVEEAIALINTVLGDNFLNADLFTTQEDVHLKFNKKRVPKMFSKKPTHTSTGSDAHDVPKQRPIQPKDNPYLLSLGVVDQRGEVIKTMAAKYKQINKYVEILDGLLSNFSQQREWKVVDMGAGKGYLTFALYDYMTNTLGLKVRMTGIETQESLVKYGKNLAEKSNFAGLSFEQGNIEEFQPDKNIDMLIALHACDTATDDALLKAIVSETKIVVVAPCCHKQVRQQMDTQSELAEILKFGILKERQAELITDGLRALILQAQGYETKVFEFISSEYTSKNTMIVGIKGEKTPPKAKILNKIEKIKEYFGIEYHYLEKLLENPSPAPGQDWRIQNPVCETKI